MRSSGGRRRDDRGSAVVDIVLVLVILIPLVLGIAQTVLVMHVRATLASAAAEGARAAAVQGGTAEGAVARTRDQVRDAIAARFARDIAVRRVQVGGQPMIEITVRAEVPALGLGGPAFTVEAVGHAVVEPAP
ncbi:TadE/TadG family type IV pilus assembly protein [Nocardioides sp.]|uniref:TadE/TadG family type IV pilus assembly protein n=1 Tax=Nocardioides sp. TaxID=35761 RepID=UPI003510E5B5